MLAESKDNENFQNSPAVYPAFNYFIRFGVAPFPIGEG
jgi:hypothetical protein